MKCSFSQRGRIEFLWIIADVQRRRRSGQRRWVGLSSNTFLGSVEADRQQTRSGACRLGRHIKVWLQFIGIARFAHAAFEMGAFGDLKLLVENVGIDLG